jgi:hypothetical protein
VHDESHKHMKPKLPSLLHVPPLQGLGSHEFSIRIFIYLNYKFISRKVLRTTTVSIMILIFCTSLHLNGSFLVRIFMENV